MKDKNGRMLREKESVKTDRLKMVKRCIRMVLYKKREVVGAIKSMNCGKA